MWHGATINLPSICSRLVGTRGVLWTTDDNPSADSETIVKVMKDVLLRFNLPINLMRGQCKAMYEANYMKRVHTQARIQEETRVLFIHCNYNYSLNLAFQETCYLIKLQCVCFTRSSRCATFINDSRIRSFRYSEK